MPKETCEPKRLESIRGMGVDEFWFACEQPNELLCFSGGGGLENAEVDGLFSEKICNGRLLVIGCHEDRAESIFSFVDQTWC